MGNKFEVYEWVCIERLDDYEYEQRYNGQSFFKAMWTMIILKIFGAGCVKLEWRK